MKVVIVKENVVMIESTITEQEVKVLESIAPDALVLKDEKGNELFKVEITSGKTSLSKYGFSVNAKRPQVIIEYDRPVTEEKVRADFGPGLLKLSALEAQVAAAYAANQVAMGQIQFELLD